jgi:hypothetical protein
MSHVQLPTPAFKLVLPPEKYPLVPIGDWVGPRVDLDVVQKRKISFLLGV